MADLTVKMSIDRNGVIEPFNSFSKKDLLKMKNELSKTMSRYYTNHLEEIH